MSKTKKIAIIVILLLAAGVFWYGLSPLFMNTIADDPLPVVTERSEVDATQTAPIAQLAQERSGVIVPTPAHPASGTVRVIADAGEQILRYENFKTINGPDLRIYLATNTQATEFVDLGPIKATQGNVNYSIPAGTDLSKYRYALTWCEDFSVLFNSAELSDTK